MKNQYLLPALLFLSCTLNNSFAQPADLPWDPDPDCNIIVTTGIVAVSCGIISTLPEEEHWTIGLIDINGALPAVGRIDVTSQIQAYHHPSWHIDSIGNIFGMTIDGCGNVYAAASCNYASFFFGFESVLRYGELGGGANDLNAAGTVYKIDGQTAQASAWAVLPQQAFSFEQVGCETFITVPRVTGPGLGNLTYSYNNQTFYVTNFEDGRIYRLDTLGTILESYDPFDLDNGAVGTPPIDQLPYGITLNLNEDILFFGTVGSENFNGPNSGIYSIPLNPDGSFSGTVDNSVMPPGATWDNLVGTELTHTTFSYFSTNFISDMEFAPDGRLLIGQRVGCNDVVSSSYNHDGRTLVYGPDVNGIYNIELGVIVSSNGFISPTNAYGGVTVFELPNGEFQFIMSNADMLSEAGPHGIVVSPSNAYGTAGNPASPQGIISYNDPSVNGDPKGIGGDVVVFKACDCEKFCPQGVLTEPLTVCSNEPFSLEFALVNGNADLTANWTFEDGSPVPDPTNVTIQHSDCAPGTYQFYLTALCELEQTTEYLDTLQVTVITDDLSPFFTIVEEECFVDLQIDPACAAYIELIGTIPDIMIGDSGTVFLELMQTTNLVCVQQSVALSFNCQCFYDDFTFEQEVCENGQYYISLDFRPNGADEGFTLTDLEGNTYGPYNYTDLPVQIGPFVGDAVSTYALFIQDDNLTECTGSFNFGPLYCPPGQAAWQSTDPTCLVEFGTLEAISVVGGAAPYQYSIDGGLTFSPDPFFPNIAPGTYQVIIRDAMGALVSSTEVVVPVDEISLSVVETFSILLGESQELDVQIDLLPNQIDSIIWMPTEGLSCTDCLNPIAQPTQSTEYTVRIIDINGCEATGRILVDVRNDQAIYIPNAFSPNNDGINDLFMIFARDNSVERIRTFLVFDRWGDLVHEYENFQPNDPAAGWDGRFRGQLMNPAVFAYFAIVDFRDGQEVLYEGDVTLVR